jgi:hypothetical protein
MSNTTAIILIFMACLLLLASCIAACVLIGRYYVRICTRKANYCAEVDERVDLLMDEIVRVQYAETEVIPVARPDSETLFRTRGQRQRSGGRHRHDPHDYARTRR